MSAVKQVIAMRGAVKQADDIHEGGLTTTTRAHNSHELIFINSQRNLVESQSGGIAEAVQLADVFEFYERHLETV